MKSAGQPGAEGAQTEHGNGLGLRALFEVASVGIVQMDPRDGRLLRFNKRFREMTGYTEEELCILAFRELTHPEDRAKDWELFSRAARGEAPEYHNEKRYVRKDGTAIWVRVNAAFLRDAAGQAVSTVAVCEDITERKQAEHAMSFLAQCGTASGEDFFQSLARYLAENLGMDFVCIDRLEGEGLSARTEAVFYDGRIEPNLSYRLTDTPCASVVGQQVCSFPSGVRQQFPQDTVLQEMRAESYVGVTLTGCSGKPIGLIAVIGRRPLADPHAAEFLLNLVAGRAASELERRQTEQVVRASEERLAQLVKMAPAFMCVLRGPNLVVELANEEYYRLVGRRDLLGKPLLEALPELEGQPYPQLLGRVLQTGQPYQSSESSVRLARGPARDLEERWVDFIYLPLQEADGSIGGIFVHGVDVTERKQAERQLRELNRALQASSASSHALMHAETEEAYLGEVCRIVVRDCGYAMVWIGLAENDAAKTVRPVAHAGFENGYLETLGITWDETEKGRGPTGTAIRTGQPSLCRNMLTDPRFAPWREQARQRGYASSVVLPLRSEGKTFGALNIYASQPDAFSPGEVDLLTRLADDLAYGIATLRLRAAHQQAEQALRENQDHLLIAQKAGRLGTFDLDLRSGKGFWSEDRRKMLGVPPEHKATRETWWALVPEPDRGELLASLARAFSARRREWELQYRVRQPDGRERWLEDRAWLSYDAAGQPVRMVGTTTDVTREVEAKTRSREQQLEFRASALRAVLILAASVFLAEGAIMAALAEFPALGPWYSGALDSVTLLALVSPMLYFFAFRPLVRILRQREAVEEALRRVNEHLEERVRDRTASLERANQKFAAEVIEREKAEAKSRRAKEEWERTFDAVPDLIAILDDRHSILRANRAMAQRLGLTPSRCVGRVCYEMVHGTTCPHPSCPHNRTLADGLEHTLELNEPRLGGDFLVSTTPLRDEAGRQVASVHVARDISAIKQAEAALRESQAALQKSHAELEQRVRQRTEELTRANAALESEVAERRRAELAVTTERQRFQDVFDRLPAYLVLLSPDYRVPFANRFFEERFGKAQGRRCYEYLFNRTTPCENCRTFEVLKTKAPQHWEWTGPDGRIYEIYDSLFVDVDGSQLILEVGLDISDRKAADHERQHLRNELARVTRITTAGQLSAALAHELNQPLGAIVCNVQAARQLLATAPPDLSEVRETLRDIEADSKRAGEVIHQLRGLFQRAGQSRTALELNPLVDSTLQLMHSEFILKGVEPQVELDPRLPGILGNRVELQQVMLNLVTNALEAMASCKPGGRRLRISTAIDGPGKVRIAVSDSGHGIPPEQLSRVFDAFFTTKASGMGMGLSICRSIVEAHGGRLWAENNPDRGATFHLALPAAPSA